MKLLIVLCIAIVPILGQQIQPPVSQPPATNDDTPKLTPRIVNGKLAAINQFPWQVSVQPISAVGAVLARCSGSLISSNHVLTAAHCVRDYSTFRVGIGSININAPQVVQQVTRGNVAIHPRYDNRTLNNDLAILKLNYDVQQGTLVKTIRLPRRAQSGFDYFKNKAATISGWGRTTDASTAVSDLLRFTSLNVTTNSYCKMVYGSTVVVNTTLCGIGIPSTSSPCGGDSGSPLVVNDVDGEATQIGIFSFVADYGCSNGYPSGFTYVAAFLDWISQNTGIPIRN